jgi:hypothetical protein
MTSRTGLALTAAVLGLLPRFLPAQSAADSAGIRAAALDYIEGWYSGDATRMTRAVHPELAKRIVETDPKAGKSVLSQMGAKELIDYTRQGGDAIHPLIAVRPTSPSWTSIEGRLAPRSSRQTGWTISTLLAGMAAGPS